jgi:hypothetical protein
MTARARNRLLALGVTWGLLLAAVPVLVMAEPYRLTGFLVAALVCAALSGCMGTLAAGRWAARSARRGGVRWEGVGRPGLWGGARIGALQGLVGGGVAALLFWALMALAISGFTLRNPVELSVLMSPRVFMGSFFVALSVFLYAFVVGLLLGPVFGTLVSRAVRADRDAGSKAGGKEDLVVR